MKLGCTPRFDEAWCLQRGQRFAHADSTPREWMGKTWERTLAMACPGCGAVFFTFKPVGSDWRPYDDPRAVPAPGNGIRETCGDPRCHEREERRFYGQDEEYRKTCKKYFDEKAGRATSSGSEFKPKLVKLGE